MHSMPRAATYFKLLRQYPQTFLMHIHVTLICPPQTPKPTSAPNTPDSTLPPNLALFGSFVIATQR